jgi:hypothetical protein
MANTTSTNLKSGVWAHFNRNPASQMAECKLCKAKLKSTGGSTKSLHTHLQGKHAINVLKREEPGTPSPSAGAAQAGPEFTGGRIVRPGSIKKFILCENDNSLEATVARLVACDGLSLNVIATSPDLRRVLETASFSKVPKSHNTVRSMVLSQGEKVRSFVMSDIKSEKERGNKFALTFDEWTSSRNRRYMVVNVHQQGPKFWSLGLIRVSGTMPAEKCVVLLEQKLHKFGLDLCDDIVAIVTDGASVMVKVGKLISAEQQLCYAHGIQLAVVDVLYKRKRKTEVDAVAGGEPGDNLGAEAEIAGMAGDNGVDDDDDELPAEDDDGEESDGELQVEENVDMIAELSDEYQEVVDKVRKVVKFFRRSPTQNDDVLQKYVKQDHGKELSLILDCRTRWSSLLAMLSRFLELRNSIQKSLIDLKMSAQIADADFQVVGELVSTLEPVALAVQALSNRNTNLISAEAAIHFCIVQLQKRSSELAKTMADTLLSRMKQRCTLHSGILHYLHNCSDESSSDFNPVPSTSAIRKFLLRLLLRLDKVHYNGR